MVFSAHKKILFRLARINSFQGESEEDLPASARPFLLKQEFF
jgi:hypothetical protein